jgi:hypothetical protein
MQYAHGEVSHHLSTPELDLFVAARHGNDHSVMRLNELSSPIHPIGENSVAITDDCGKEIIVPITWASVI